jgi:4'-phosphopantetheinyl transferase
MRITVLIVDDVALSEGQEAGCLARLPEARRRELLDWPDARARQRSLLGSRLLQLGLQRVGAPATSFASLHHPRGAKPCIDPPYEFSLAHCEGRVGCAVTTGSPVGLDVEHLGSLTAGSSGLYLAPAERAWAGDDSTRFYVLWTRKEAVAKAAGLRGLRDLRAVEIDGTRARANGRAWHTTALDLGPEFIAHLACAEARPIVDLVRLDPETLL